MLFATGTESGGSDTGGLRTNDDASFSYTLSSLATTTAEGCFSQYDYEAGQYSDGSYSFSSAVHDEHAEDSTSYAVTETLVREGTGTWVNDRSGISTSGVNGTFLYSASGSMTVSESGRPGSQTPATVMEPGSQTPATALYSRGL